MPFLLSLIVLIIILIITVIISKTYAIKNKFLLWSAIIIPPLLLIYLIWIPVDMVTLLLWFPGAIAFLISAVSTIVNFVKFLRLSKDKKEEIGKIKIRLIRPMLTMLVFLFAILCLAASRKSADNYAATVGKKIQGICSAEELCPESIAGWSSVPEESGYNSVIFYGKYGTKYRVSYSVSKDRKSFNIEVKHNIDEGLSIKGGVGKQLKIKLWSS